MSDEQAIAEAEAQLEAMGWKLVRVPMWRSPDGRAEYMNPIEALKVAEDLAFRGRQKLEALEWAQRARSRRGRHGR